MTDLEFSRFGEFIEGQLGIKMPLAKKTMLQGRLQKRLRFLELDSFSVYADYVLIFAWNFAKEIISKIEPLRAKGVKFIVPLPEPEMV